FRIVRVPVVQTRHRRFVSCRARSLIHGLILLEENGQGFDPVALTLRFRSGGPSLLDGFPALLQKRGSKWRRQWIRSLTDGNAPVRHRARWLLLRYGLERLLGLRVEKGMQHCHSAIELLLRSGAAGDGEVDLAEVACIVVADVFVLRRRKRKCSGKNQGQR